MMSTTELIDEWYPHFGVIFKFMNFIRIDNVFQMTGDHIFFLKLTVSSAGAASFAASVETPCYLYIIFQKNCSYPNYQK